MIDQKIINKYLDFRDDYGRAWHEQPPGEAEYCNRPAEVAQKTRQLLEDMLKDIAKAPAEWPEELVSQIEKNTDAYKAAINFYDVGIAIIDHALKKESRHEYFKRSIRYKLKADHGYYVLHGGLRFFSRQIFTRRTPTLAPQDR